MVLQDSQAALNPRMTVREAVEEPMRLSGCFQDGAAERALEDVGLFACDSFLTRRIHALSGGQRQRVAIARALTMEPALLIADEPTSMLDPSGKANLLRMLKGLQNSRGFSMLFITHGSGQRPEDLRPHLPPGGREARPAGPQRPHPGAL